METAQLTLDLDVTATFIPPRTAKDWKQWVEASLKTARWPLSLEEVHSITPGELRPDDDYSDTIFHIPGRNMVLKIDECLEPQEAAIQLFLSRHNLALPVLYFGEVENLSPVTRKHLEQHYLCDSKYFMLMPIAEPVLTQREVEEEADTGPLESPAYDQVYEFINQVKKFLFNQLRFVGWEAAARHVMRYEGHFVAIDLEC